MVVSLPIWGREHTNRGQISSTGEWIVRPAEHEIIRESCNRGGQVTFRMISPLMLKVDIPFTYNCKSRRVGGVKTGGTYQYIKWIFCTVFADDSILCYTRQISMNYLGVTGI